MLAKVMTQEEREAFYQEERERLRWAGATTAARLRIKAESPPLMNKKPIIVDKTPSRVREGLTARGRLEHAAPNERLGVVLAMREWRGSVVQQSTSIRGETVYDLRHPSGARMRLVGGMRQ